MGAKRKRHRANRMAAVGPREPVKWAIPTGSVGAMNEMLVAADLLRRGYEVFRAVSPCAPCDLLVLSGALLLRVEVRSTVRDRYGWLARRQRRKDVGRYDIRADVEPSGRIHYRGLPDAQ